jgi:hypothetical protein
MKAYFTQKDIRKHSAQNQAIKASMAERMIQTIKHRLYKYFSNKHTLNWLEGVPQITTAINQTVCRTTGLKPASVNFENAGQLWKRLYGDVYEHKDRRPLLKVDDSVRVSHNRRAFDKEYLPTFSDPVFNIQQVIRGDPHTYELHNPRTGQSIKGNYYKEELARTSHQRDYIIEEVLRTRKRDGVKEHLVKWLGPL